MNRAEAIKAMGGFALTPMNPVTRVISPSAQHIEQGVFNVRDWGAKGDGITDDTGPVQAAINAVLKVPGGTVFFPTGRYRITSTLTVIVNTDHGSVNFRFLGNGSSEVNEGGINGEGIGWGSQLVFTARGGDLLLLQLSGGGNARIRFEARDMAFVGNGDVRGATGGGGLHFQAQAATQAVWSHLIGCRVLKAKNDGIWLDGNNICQWFDVQSNQHGGRGIYLSGHGTIFTSRESRLAAVSCYLNGSHGVEIERGGAVWMGLTCSNNSGKALQIDSTAEQNTFYGLQCEANAIGPVVDVSANGQQVFGLLIGYNGVGSVIGLRLNAVNNCEIHALMTDSAPGQTDILFASGNTHSNLVTYAAGGDALYKGHIIDNSGNPGNMVQSGGRIMNLDVANGTGAAGFGTNTSPALIPGTVYRWLRLYLADGTVVYVPCWK